jgi:hypothetical protein
LKTRFDHEEIKRLIQQDLPQAHIAVRVGCSRERIRQLEEKYFGTTGHDRQTARRIERLATPPDNPFTRAALARGLKVESFVSQWSNKKKRLVFINGHLCCIYKMTPRKIGNHVYLVIRAPQVECDFCIGVNPKGFLIMPHALMPLQTVCSLEPKNRMNRPVSYSKRHDYLNYLNAWDQLKKGKHENLKAS